MAKISERHSEHHSETFTGPREDQLEARKKHLKEAKALIDKALKDYEGEMIVIVRANQTSDDKGTTQVAVAGTGNVAEQMHLIEGLKEAAETVEKEIGSAIDPDTVLQQLLHTLKSHSK